jgi:glycosyltransferase involved in cell wall biosynthesis
VSRTAGPSVGLVYFGSYPDIRVTKVAVALAEAGMRVRILARRDQLADPVHAHHPYAAQVAERHRALSGRLSVHEVAAGAPAHLTMPYHVNPLWRHAVRNLADVSDVLIVRDIPLLLAARAAARRTRSAVVLDMAENYPEVLLEWRRWEGWRASVVNSVLRNVHLARALERRSVRASDAVITVVQESACRVRAMTGAPDVHVIENTPELDVLDAVLQGPAPAFGPRRELEIVYTGEVHVYRGIDTVIDAAAHLRDHGVDQVRWHLIGTGKVAERLEASARARGLADDVVFWGWQQDVMPWLRAADAGVVPAHDSLHYRTTMPNKVYETMAAARPVIVSDVAPMRRVVRSTGCGLAFRAGDPVDLSSAVLQLLDRHERARMGAAGRAAVEGRYRWDVDAAALVDVVDGLARRRSMAAR